MTKRGGQPKNTNALKHGIFSQFISLVDDQSMAYMNPDDRSHNLAMARVRFVAALQKQLSTTDLKDWLSCDYAAHYWLDSINQYQNQAEEKAVLVADIWSTFRDAVRASNDRQGWKR
jgi:hypothetical protein